MINGYFSEAEFNRRCRVKVSARRRGAGYDMSVTVPCPDLYRHFNFTVDRSDYVDYSVNDKEKELECGTTEDIASVVKEHCSLEIADYVSDMVKQYQKLSNVK